MRQNTHTQQMSLPQTEGFRQSEYQSKSQFTLLVYFRNGYTKGMKFHSFKQETRKIGGVYVKDHRYAFNRLMYLVEELYHGKYKTAIVYHNPTGTTICTFAYDKCKDMIPLAWKTEDNGDVVLHMPEPKVQNMQKRMLKLQDANFYKY